MNKYSTIVLKHLQKQNKKLLQDKNVSGVTPRLESFALASSEDITKGCLVVGINPEKENQITSLKE